MTLPQPLQQLADGYNQIVKSYNESLISEQDAMANLRALSCTDAAGAIWAVAPEGTFTRADFPGSPPMPADASQFIAEGSQLPPSPAFPAPAGFPGDLDTPPLAGPANNGWGPATGPATLATPPMPGQDFHGRPAKVKSIKADRTPRGGGVGAKLTAWFQGNKVLAIIAIVGVLLVGAAVLVPRLTGGTGDTRMPTDTLPGEQQTTGAPAVTAPVPSTVDAATVTAALQSADPAQVQSVIVATLDAPTLLRTQALWAGLAQSAVTLTAEPAAQTGERTATQVWTLTREGEDTAVASITVTWTSDGTTWKIDQPPTF